MSDEQVGGGRDVVAWWSPTGWLQKQPPAVYAPMWDGPMQDWQEAHKNAGYDEKIAADQFGLDFDITVFFHGATGHLVVYVTDLTTFFVSDRDVPAFWVDKYPTLLSHQLLRRHAEASDKLAKVMLAWVRHGPGEATIDAFGDETRDERLANLANLRWREKQAQQQSARKSGASTC